MTDAAGETHPNLDSRLVASVGGTARANPESDAAGAGIRLSLRTKGMLAFAAWVIYIAGIAMFVVHDRQVLLHIVQQLEQAHDEENALVAINMRVSHFIVEAQHALNAKQFTTNYDDIALDLASAHFGLAQLKVSYPEIAAAVYHFTQQAAKLPDNWSIANLGATRDRAQELSAQLGKLESIVQTNGARLSGQYRELNQSITMIAMVMSLSGVVLFGAVVVRFFTRLATDIQKLETRTSEIVGGHRGPPLEVRRGDEVGSLTAAINRIQSELVLAEQKKMISWQQRFYRDRMAAVGSLATAVAHEVGNPLSSISGIAQLLVEQVRTNERPDDATLCHHAELVIGQAERIAAILRQLADLGTTHEAEAQLLNVNEVVQAVCTLVRFDRRFRGIDIKQELAPGNTLPAALAVADHMTQVLMNLLINAADAMEGLESRPRVIRVSTHCSDGEIVVSVVDNGQGMAPDVLSRAFDESFTTKPLGKGRGIGLHLCRLLIEAMDGRIELESSPGAGASAHVYLPLPREPADAG